MWHSFLEEMLMDFHLFDTGLDAVWLLVMDPRLSAWIPSETFVWNFVGLWQDFYDKTFDRHQMFSAFFEEFVKRRPVPISADFLACVLDQPKLFVEEMLTVALQDTRFDTLCFAQRMAHHDEIQFLLDADLPRHIREKLDNAFEGNTSATGVSHMA